MTQDMKCMCVAGTVVPSKTKIAYHFSTLVLTYGQQHTLQIEPRDEYGNPTSNSVSLVDEVNYSVQVHPVRILTAYFLVQTFEVWLYVLSLYSNLFLAVPTVGHSGGGKLRGLLHHIGIFKQASVSGSDEAHLQEERLF